MSRHSASRKKEKKNRTVLYTFIVFLVVVAICAGVLFTVILMPSSEQSLKAPTSSTSGSATQTTTSATLPPTAEPEENKESKTAHPTFTKVTASSTREPYKSETGTVSYPPSNILDNNKNTVWTPNADEDNPWVEISAASPQTLKGIEIINGFSKNKKLYRANSRARDVVIECNGVRYSYTLLDKGPGKVQRLAFPDVIATDKIRIVISSVYNGDEYSDLCISEIKPYK